MNKELIDTILKHSASNESAKVIIKSVKQEFKKHRKRWGYLKG